MTSKEQLQILARRNMAKVNPFEDFIDVKNGDDYFFDQFSGQFFRSNKESILAAELMVNRQLVQYGECSASVFYDVIGFKPEADEPQNYFWSTANGLYWVDFDHIYVDYEDEYPFYHLIVMIPEPEPIISLRRVK